MNEEQHLVEQIQRVQPEIKMNEWHHALYQGKPCFAIHRPTLFPWEYTVIFASGAITLGYLDEDLILERPLFPSELSYIPSPRI